MNTIHAFIIDLGKGGAQGVFITLVNYLAKKNYNVKVVVQNRNDTARETELAEGIEVISLESNSAKEATIKTILFVKNNPIEVSWVFGPELAINLLIARTLCSGKFPILARSINTLSEEFKRTSGFFRKYVTGNLIKLLFNKVDHVVAQSERMRRDLIDHYNFEETQVTTIYNALAYQYELELTRRETVPKENYILYAGRLEEQKGIKMLITAFSKLQDETVKLLIIGDGSQKKDLMQCAKDLLMDNRIVFIPYTSTIIDYYKKAKCVVLTSYYEGFPNVLIEANACGTPVVSFDLPSGPSEIINNENGILVEYLNVDAFTRALEDALYREWNRDVIKESAKRFCSDQILGEYIAIMDDRRYDSV